MLPFEWLEFRNPYGFLTKIREVSEKLQIKPEWLMMCIWMECRFNSQAINPVSQAFGLIQFLPSTLKGLGYSMSSVKGRFGEWQLEKLVYPYLKPYAGKMNSAYDVYLAIFYPAALGKPEGYVIAREHEKAYINNSVLDTFYGDHDGKLEVIDVKMFFRTSLKKSLNLHKRSAQYSRKIPVGYEFDFN